MIWTYPYLYLSSKWICSKMMKHFYKLSEAIFQQMRVQYRNISLLNYFHIILNKDIFWLDRVWIPISLLPIQTVTKPWLQHSLLSLCLNIENSGNLEVCTLCFKHNVFLVRRSVLTIKAINPVDQYSSRRNCLTYSMPLTNATLMEPYFYWGFQSKRFDCLNRQFPHIH